MLGLVGLEGSLLQPFERPSGTEGAGLYLSFAGLGTPRVLESSKGTGEVLAKISGHEMKSKCKDASRN